MLKISDGKGKWHFLTLPSDIDEDGVKRPYKSLSRIMEGIASNIHENYYCLGCFHSFRTETTLQNHAKFDKFAKIDLPEEGSNFKRYKPGAKSLKMDTVRYADFESILVPYSTCEKEHDTCKKVNKEVPCGYSINVGSTHRKTSKQYCYRGEDAVGNFCKKVRTLAYDFINIYKQPMIDLTECEKYKYDDAKYCHNCKKVFGEAKKHKKVPDHDHYTGKFRGAAHSICTLRYSTQKDIPVFFHNGTNYHFNLVIPELAKEFKSELQCIPLNGQKFMSFFIPIKKKTYANSRNTKKKLLTYNLRFIDSARHMNESLCTLVDNLSGLKNYCEKKSFDNIKITYKEINNDYIVNTRCKACLWRKDIKLSELVKNFPNTFNLCRGGVEKFPLLLRKGVYPYEYMKNISQFDEKELTTIDNFYNKLNSSGISTKDYSHAKKVLQFFKIKDMGEYHDLYVRFDVAQLSDVFENFRSLCLKIYELDPSYFVSTPGLAFEAMVKCTKVKLELLTDIEMVLMVEKVICGGLTQVVKRHAVANHRYLPGYDASKKSVFLQYLDANNLYGYAMSRKLPLDGYKWDNIDKFTSDFVKNYDDNGDKGYLLEVDVEYPKDLLSAHGDLPFLPKRRYKIPKHHYQKRISPINIEEYGTDVIKKIARAHKKVHKAFNISHEPENKLIATVQDKNKYVCNISTLKIALDHGLRLIKVHRAIEFNHITWLKKYIDMNTELRKNAKNDFEKNFFKLKAHE